jgi:phosphate transport system substrate-binding protein
MKKIIMALMASIALSANAFTITGAGASFPYPIYAKWAESFKADTGNIVNYQSIGSSGGIKQIDKKTVDFGASDVARTQEELDKMGQIQFPMVMGGVVLVVNLEGVTNNQIDLTITQVADIFRGKITNWKELGQGLPDMPIILAVRSAQQVYSPNICLTHPLSLNKTLASARPLNGKAITLVARAMLV